ncbi:hypothetical protein AAKU64_002005, partial [Undibacterium sp. GrIS 1.8]
LVCLYPLQYSSVNSSGEVNRPWTFTQIYLQARRLQHHHPAYVREQQPELK